MRLTQIMATLGIALAPLSLVGLGACVGTTVAAEAPVPAEAPAFDIQATGDHVVLSGARAFAAAELAYITAADGVGRLADAGIVRGSLATEVRTWNRRARQLLVAGRGTADVARKASVAAELFGIADRLQKLRK